MRPEAGNAAIDGASTRGWIVGHFLGHDSLRNTDAVEIKWATHEAGECSEWKSQPGKKTISLLLSGEFDLEIRSEGMTDIFFLRKAGDFVVWEDEREHRWTARTKASVLTVRWPSALENGSSSLTLV